MVRAVAVLRGESTVNGTVTFTQESETSPTVISYDIRGNDPNAQRGIHIHEFGDITNGCSSAGPHFNPFKRYHGAPEDDERHAGDLGNINTDAQGTAVRVFNDGLIKLIGPESIIGRSVVVHAKIDDLGKGGNPESRETGNAGDRRACGVIGITTKLE